MTEYLPDRGTVQGVQASTPVAAFGHESRLPEETQMPGHRRPANVESSGDLPGRVFAVPEPFQDGASYPVTHSLEGDVRSVNGGVSHN